MKRNTKIVSLLKRIALICMCVSFISLHAFSQVCAPQLVTQWGSTGSRAGQIHDPRDVAVDTAGNVYVADRLNGRVQKFDAEGNYLLQWRGSFTDPISIAVDVANNIYVGGTNRDRSNAHIEKFTADGVFLTRWGSSGTGNGQFSYPGSISRSKIVKSQQRQTMWETTP